MYIGVCIYRGLGQRGLFLGKNAFVKVHGVLVPQINK
jgi:hypothetical protein